MSQPPLGFLIVDAARLYRARIDRVFEHAGLGLTAGEARTLIYVHLNPGLRQSALAERMSVEPMTLVAFLDRLEGQALVRREPDPSDRRAKRIHLTPEAAPLLEQIMEVGAVAREAALAGATEAEVEVFRHVLDILRTNLTKDTGAVGEP